jgi:hypothetical protein
VNKKSKPFNIPVGRVKRVVKEVKQVRSIRLTKSGEESLKNKFGSTQAAVDWLVGKSQQEEGK